MESAGAGHSVQKNLQLQTTTIIIYQQSEFLLV